MYHDADNLDTAFDAGGKVSIGLTATTIVSQWTWSATLLQSSTVASKVIFHCSADGRSENLWVRGAQGVKVEKILKGSLDWISSPSRTHEHLNLLFLFFSTKHFGQKVC